MPEANPHRGEVAVKIGDRDLILRPTFEAMAEIETALGMGLVSVTRRFVAQEYGVRDIVPILLAGANAALRPGEKLKADLVKQAVTEQGLFAFSGVITTFLTNCLTGGAEPGEAKAAETE